MRRVMTVLMAVLCVIKIIDYATGHHLYDLLGGIGFGMMAWGDFRGMPRVDAQGLKQPGDGTAAIIGVIGMVLVVIYFVWKLAANWQ